MNLNIGELRVGLVGVGLLGSALAERLIQHDVSIIGFDIDSARMDALTAMGGVTSDSPGHVFKSCNCVLLSLPTSDAVSELLSQNASVIPRDSTIVDTTTGNPEQMIAIGQSLHKLGIQYIEANVAGSSEQVRTGDVTLFMGGDATTVTRMKPLLKAITDKHFYLGPVGAASRFKLIHNLLLGLHRATLAEGLTFAESLGFSPQTTLEILQQTPAASAVMENKGPKMVAGDYALQARLSQHLKDVRLILAQAESTGAKTPLSEIHKTLLEYAEHRGFGDADNSAIMEAYRHEPNVEIKKRP